MSNLLTSILQRIFALPFFLFCVLCGTYEVSGQSSNRNYVLTRTMLDASGGSYTERIDYFDDLGRIVQSNRKNASPSGADILTAREYDGFGRVFLDYLPVPVNGNSGSYVDPGMIGGMAFLFYNDVYNATLTKYEPSPMDRVTDRYGPGTPWLTSRRPVKTEHFVNASSGELSCALFTVASGSSLRRVGLYDAGELYVTKTTDEDLRSSYVFTDKLDRVVLERAADDSIMHDTYYIYDDLGNLRYVLSPEASAALAINGTWGDDSQTLKDYVYVYKYDGRCRCVSARTPGCDWVLTCYDKADRPIFLQDGNQRAVGEWTFLFYDAFGRQVATGVWGASTVPDVSGMTVRATYTGGAMLGGYSVNLSIPSSVKLATVKYYDSYDFLGTLPAGDRAKMAAVSLSGYGSVFPDNSVPAAKGLPTGVRLYGLDDPMECVVTVSYYDSRRRLVQTHTARSAGGYADTYFAYTFTGKMSASREVVILPDGHADTLEKTMSYDSQERLLSETAALNGTSDTTVYSYDEVERLTGKTYGTGAAATTEALTYNLRGWQTGQTCRVFSMNLRYTEPATGTVPCYSGNVAEWTWTREGSTPCTYSFTYDLLGRVKDSRCYVGSTAVPSDVFAERNMLYDLNGNLVSMQRSNGTASPQSVGLDYSGTGNRLHCVSGFGPGTTGSYGYDANGNMTHDGRNNLDLEYNDLNLVGSVSRNGSVLANYSYLADGTKVRAVDGDGAGLEYRGALTYRRTPDGHLRLESAATPGGRIVALAGPDGGIAGYRVLHHITDHLGSVRAVVDAASGQVLETADYLPFGQRWKASAAAGYTPSTDNDNRWRFSGKEEQSFLGTDPVTGTPNISFIDYGARMYDPALGRWLATDPMAGRRYNISPYVFCGNNPVNLVDPDGMDWYTINSSGETKLRLKTEDQFDQLFAVSPDGEMMSDRFLKVNNKKVLPLMSRGEYVPAGGNMKDMLDIFYFASDSFIKQEWGLYSNGSRFALKTDKRNDSVGSPFDYSLDPDEYGPTTNATRWKIHSHSDTGLAMRDELESMGFWYEDKNFNDRGGLNPNSIAQPSNYYNDDWKKYKRDFISTGGKPATSLVYFPKSGRTYRIGYNNAVIIRNRK